MVVYDGTSLFWEDKIFEIKFHFNTDSTLRQNKAFIATGPFLCFK